MQLRRLVLPAPFGPMMALKAPGWTEKLTSWRAVTPPKRRTRWEMSRRGDDIRRKTTCLLYRGERSPLWPDPTPNPNPTHEAPKARVPIPDPRLRGCLKTLYVATSSLRVLALASFPARQPRPLAPPA